MLSGLCVLDFTTRLPGPLGASLLAKRGARVIKIEDTHYQDPFVREGLAAHDHSFAQWYEALNKDKEIVRIDFKATEVKELLAPYFAQAQAVIVPANERIQQLVNLFNPQVVLTLKASEDLSAAHTLHDLNVLALKKILRLHALQSASAVIAPPFVPIAGICFGSSLALDLMSALWQAREHGKTVHIHSTLEKAVDEQLMTLYSEKLRGQGTTRFLHNGAYPCYNIYRTSDGHAVAFAAIESHLWERFCQIFNCPIKPSDRFTDSDHNPKLIEQMRMIFGSLTLKEIESKLATHKDGHNLCITPFEL